MAPRRSAAALVLAFFLTACQPIGGEPVPTLMVYDAYSLTLQAFDAETGDSVTTSATDINSDMGTLWLMVPHPSGDFIARDGVNVARVQVDGTIAWRYYANPAIQRYVGGNVGVDADGNVYAAFDQASSNTTGTTTTVYALAAADGSVLWSESLTTTGASASAQQAAVGYANDVVFVAVRGQVFALDASDGTQLDSATVSGYDGSNTRLQDAAMSGSAFMVTYYQRDSGTLIYSSVAVPVTYSGGLSQASPITLATAAVANDFDYDIYHGASTSDAAYFVGQAYGDSSTGEPWLVRVTPLVVTYERKFPSAGRELYYTVGVRDGYLAAGLQYAGSSGATVIMHDPATGDLTGDSFAADTSAQTVVVLASEEVAAPSTAVQNATDRLRSRVSEDTGSVLDSVEVRVVDASLSVDFTNAVTLEPLTLTNYRDALRATDSATVDATFYPRPVQNTSEEQQFDGITMLSRLATWYPPPIFDTVANLGIVSSGSATAQQVLQYLLDRWATEADWFTAELAPDLRLRINGYAPSDYTATDGLVECETVAIAQDGENRRTARQILDDLLSPFPSTIVRQNSSGNLAIVPVYGPDADETAYLTLSNDDLHSVSQGKPDPWLIKNRATATCTGYSRQEEVEVMQPAWFQIGSNYQLGKDTWYSPPSDRLNLQPPPDGFDTLQESLSSGEFSQQRPALWPRSTSNIPAGTGISLQDGGSAATITAAWSRYNDTSLQASGSGTLTLIETEVPFDGVWRPTFRWDEGSQYVVMGCRWNAARGGVELAINSAFLESGCVTGCKGWVVEFTLNDSSVGYATGVRKSATFGVIDDANPDQSDTLPSTTGNAIDESQTAYGVLEATINIRGYDLDVGTLREIATAYVVENITPRVTRDLDVSTWGVGVTFDAIGRLIELPSGEQGVLTSVEYADDFTAQTLRRTARVQLKNTTATGALDTASTQYTTTKSGNDYLATTAGEIYKTTG